MKKTQRIIFHFCFIFRVFCFQAKEILTVWSSTLCLILPVGYAAPQKLIHAEWPAVLKCLWENKMVWLQLLSHKIMKKKKKKRIGIHNVLELVLFPLVSEDWDLPVGMTLGCAKGSSILLVRCSKGCTSWGHEQSSQGQPGASNAPVKLQSLSCCRGGGTRVKEMQTHFKCKYQGNSLH